MILLKCHNTFYIVILFSPYDIFEITILLIHFWYFIWYNFIFYCGILLFWFIFSLWEYNTDNFIDIPWCLLQHDFIFSSMIFNDTDFINLYWYFRYINFLFSVIFFSYRNLFRWYDILVNLNYLFNMIWSLIWFYLFRMIFRCFWFYFTILMRIWN